MQVYRLDEGVHEKGKRSGRLFCSAASWGQQERLASYANVERESAVF